MNGINMFLSSMELFVFAKHPPRHLEYSSEQNRQVSIDLMF